MLIYNLVFGTAGPGQVNCVFHDDTRASSGIGPNGEFNCFTCGAKAHNAIGFICKYFQVGFERAKRIHYAMERIQKYNYKKHPLDADQLKYLNGVGISTAIANKYFFSSAVGKLTYAHTWSGIDVGYTWFNDSSLPNHNVGHPKYKYDKNNQGGSLSPMDDVLRYKTLILCEGEKDMLTAKSMGIVNAVAKIGGAKTWALAGKPLENKRIIIVYDCDEWGREGAIQDATNLINRFDCSVKIVDLGLQDKEDLNDYFLKYGRSKQDFDGLIKATPEYVPVPVVPQDKVQQYVESLTDEEYNALKNIIKIKDEEEN